MNKTDANLLINSLNDYIATPDNPSAKAILICLLRIQIHRNILSLQRDQLSEITREEIAENAAGRLIAGKKLVKHPELPTALRNGDADKAIQILNKVTLKAAKYRVREACKSKRLLRQGEPIDGKEGIPELMVTTTPYSEYKEKVEILKKEGISKRDMDIFRQYCDGYVVWEIAQIHDIGTSTASDVIKMCRRILREKEGIKQPSPTIAKLREPQRPVKLKRKAFDSEGVL